MRYSVLGALSATFLLLSASLLPAYAASPSIPGTWYYYWIDNDGSEFYFDPKGYGTNGPRVVFSSYVSYRNGTHAITVEIYECIAGTSGLFARQIYDANSHVLDTFKATGGAKMKQIDPIGRGRANVVFNSVCSMMPPSSRPLAEVESDFQEFDQAMRR